MYKINKVVLNSQKNQSIRSNEEIREEIEKLDYEYARNFALWETQRRGSVEGLKSTMSLLETLGKMKMLAWLLGQ